MVGRKTRRRVPEILWRPYGDRARTLADTILDLIPPLTIPPEECRGRGWLCLRCSTDKDSFLLRPDDPIPYRKLLRRCFVVVHKQVPPFLDFSPRSRWSQREIVERVIEMTNCGCSSQNVICARYDKYDQSSPILESLSSSAWEVLLGRHTSIFLPFQGKKHQQVAGPPLSVGRKDTSLYQEPLLVPINKRKRDDKINPSNKRQRVSSSFGDESAKDCSAVVTSETGRANKEHSPNHRVVKPNKRSRLYLKRRLKLRQVDLQAPDSNAPCTSTCTKEKTSIGNPEPDCRYLHSNGKVKRKKPSMFNKPTTFSVIPAKHVLNTLRPNCSDSKFLMKLVFGDIKAWSTASSHGKGCCLDASMCLYHSLLKSFKSLIGKARSRHLKKLLDKHCPLALVEQEELTNANSIFQCDQRQNPEKQPHKSSTKKQTKKGENCDEGMKPYCTKHQVVSFIWAVCKSLVPEDLLGTTCQRRVIRRNIAWFVSRRRHEKCTVKQFSHKVKTSEFPFFAGKQLSCMFKGHERHDKSIRSIQHTLCSQWISWLFLEVVKKLVPSNFYVTESQDGRQNVYYYRKCSWEKLTKEAISKSLDSYIQVEKAEAKNRSRALGLSKFRLVPKENGMRIVLNFGSSSRLHSLRDSHAVLKEIQLKEPDILGSSVFDYDDVYRQLCPYLISLRSQSGDVPPLFFVVADVIKAFDSIDQDKLLHVMQCVLKDEYLLNMCGLVCRGKRSDWVSDVLVSMDKTTGWSRLTTAAPYKPLHSVIVDRGECQLLRKSDIMLWLEKMIKNNVLQLDERFHVQRVGIPQGHKLSSLLCCFYYGHLERTLVYPFLEETSRDASATEVNGEKELIAFRSYKLLRFIDDILFVSTSKEQAGRFFSRLQHGFPEYNCFMNERKFCINFEVEGESVRSSKRMYAGEDGIPFIRWTGLLINSSTFEVQVDYTRYRNNHISSTFTVAWQGKPVRHLGRKLCSFLTPKCHPILFDSNINSEAVVRLNVYQVFLLAAMKFHCYTYELSRFWKLHPRTYLKSISRSIRYMCRLIRRRMRSLTTGSSFRPVLKLYKGEVTWLGLHAFIQVLKKKQSRYRTLLTYLKSALSKHKLSRNLSQEMEYAIDRSHSSSLWQLRNDKETGDYILFHCQMMVPIWKDIHAKVGFSYITNNYVIDEICVRERIVEDRDIKRSLRVVV